MVMNFPREHDPLTLAVGDLVRQISAKEISRGLDLRLQVASSRNVLHGADEPRRAVSFFDEGSPLMHVSNLTVRSANPMHDIEGSEPGDCRLVRCDQRGPILRMNELIEGGGRGNELCSFDTEDPVDFVRPGHLARLAIEFPVPETANMLSATM